MMNGPEKSDSAIRAKKPANKAVQSAAERVEQRAGTKGNTGQPHTRRPQSRGSVSQGLDRVRHAARQRKKKFTALLHHLTIDLLRDAFLALKRHAAPGVDGVTWWDYEVGLEGNLLDLHARVHLGPLRQALGTAGFSWFLAGGLFYTLGIVFCALDARVTHFHGIWHLFVMASSATHYVAILRYVI